MRKSLLGMFLAAAVMLAAGVTTQAQDKPEAEAFLGYSYVRINPANPLAPDINANGGSGSISFNFLPWLGAVADFGGYHATNFGGTPINATLYTYMFGPKLSLRRGRITPFAQALFGGGHVSSNSFSSSNNSLAMAVGGGVDLRATQHISIRVIQAEWLLTRFNEGSGDVSQNNARISAGLVFTFGQR